MKRILKIFKFKKPINTREKYDIDLTEKIASLASTSLEKQIPLQSNQILAELTNKIDNIIYDSHPLSVSICFTNLPRFVIVFCLKSVYLSYQNII